MLHAADDQVTPLSNAETYKGQITAPGTDLFLLPGGHFLAYLSFDET